jgi:hypothetical protein
LPAPGPATRTGWRSGRAARGPLQGAPHCERAIQHYQAVRSTPHAPTTTEPTPRLRPRPRRLASAAVQALLRAREAMNSRAAGPGRSRRVPRAGRPSGGRHLSVEWGGTGPGPASGRLRVGRPVGLCSQAPLTCTIASTPSTYLPAIPHKCCPVCQTDRQLAYRHPYSGKHPASGLCAAHLRYPSIPRHRCRICRPACTIAADSCPPAGTRVHPAPRGRHPSRPGRVHRACRQSTVA